MKLSYVYDHVAPGSRGDLALSRLSLRTLFDPTLGPAADRQQHYPPKAWVKHARLVGGLLPPGVWGDKIWPSSVGHSRVAFVFLHGGAISFSFEEIRDTPVQVAAALLVLA